MTDNDLKIELVDPPMTRCIDSEPRGSWQRISMGEHIPSWKMAKEQPTHEALEWRNARAIASARNKCKQKERQA